MGSIFHYGTTEKRLVCKYLCTYDIYGIRGAGKKPQQSTELLCLCHLPQGEGELYLLCEVCKEWLHPHCVGLTQKQVDEMQDDDEYRLVSRFNLLKSTIIATVLTND